MSATVQKLVGRLLVPMMIFGCLSAMAGPAFALQPETPSTETAVTHRGGEANLMVPDLSSVEFQGINGRTLLMGGLLVSALGLLFGLLTFTQLKNLPVHSSMREVSELIYETCKTYLTTQGRFILILWTFIAVIIAAYFVLPRLGLSLKEYLPVLAAFTPVATLLAAGKGSRCGRRRWGRCRSEGDVPVVL